MEAESIQLEPRRPWEAVDLGVALFRRHARLLMLSWAALSLPLLALLSLIFWDSPGVVLVLFWLSKPLLERLPLLILAQAVFEQPPRLREALRAWPRVARRQWLASLTWRRLSPTRSFDLPVLQLEGLGGAERRRRLADLRPGQRALASWLGMLGLHLESLLWLALLAGTYLMLPGNEKWSLEWLLQLSVEGRQSLWLDHLTNLIYALLLCLLEPLYVACGFSLYLNRRCQLEAWDLQWRLPRLQTLLRNSLPALLIAVGLLAGTPHALAEETGPDQPRLQQQALDSQQARGAIQTLLEQPPFAQQERRIRWRFSPSPERDERPAPSAYSEQLLVGLEVVLWAALLLAGFWLWRRLRDWRGLLGRPAPSTEPAANAELHALLGDPRPLPADLVAAARAAWPQAPREALGLLCRGLLAQLAAPDALTETELLAQSRLDAARQPFAEALLGAYCAQAYGARTPSDAEFEQLLTEWQQLYGSAS